MSADRALAFGAVDGVVCAEAFHWLARPATVECEQLLTPEQLVDSYASISA